MSTVRKFKYEVTLEWNGLVEIDVDDGDDDEDVRDQALDLAIDEALSQPAAYSLTDYEIEDVTERA